MVQRWLETNVFLISNFTCGCVHMYFYTHSADTSLPSAKPRIYIHCLESHWYKPVRTSNIKPKLYAEEGGGATIINLFKVICQEW